MNYNKVLIGGNITRELELRYTPKGTAVLEIGVAVNRKWKDGNGEVREEVAFVDAIAWGRQAEVIAEHFGKGRPIFIEGRLAQEEWQDKETGKARRKTRVVVEDFKFCGDKRQGEGRGGAAQARPAGGQAYAAKPGERAPYAEMDDGLSGEGEKPF
jgi:single-strand DNA-binding protein